ncbi:hypothetical protein N7474_006230 [Penicillium riverlandense]|uniref:uncharacterized protein n=1 Tax=Penicillium riverlandense TaxID=1903569 RepID=UPI0025482316|nr:uncharacterized protein N7474_006230 [Penicillium riverlandense]KAJ5820639.1 hypothetical protein N7474_006230 [Penicillium riverlandense]
MKSDTSTNIKLKGSNSQALDESTQAFSEMGPVESVGLGYLSSDANDIDDAILRAQGHKAAMPRLFSAMSSLGLMFCVMNSWVGAMSTFGQNLRYGGPQCAIFALVTATFVQWIVTLGLAELASAFPSSGGQYHFTYILAPEKFKRLSAFVVGWMSVLAWWIATTSGLSLVAISATGLAAFVNPSYTPKDWHVYLCYLAMAMISVLPLFLFPKSVPKIASGSMYLSLSGFLAWFIIILAMRQHTNDGSYVVKSDMGTSGWGQGTAWALGITNAMYCFGGSDSAIHIAEEMQAPGRRLPVVMNLTMLIGFLTSVPIVVASMFTMTNMTEVMNSGFPAVELMYQVTGNRPLTIFLAAWLIVVYATGMPPQFVACGRIAWAFARDRGTPFPDYFAHIDSRLQFPARATLAALGFNALYGLLYLASTTAFNSIITSAVLFLNITLAAPQAILVLRGRNKFLPERPFKLGYLGYFCNIFSALWIPVLIVLVCMPPALPVTVGSMNYTAPVLVGILLLILGGWFVFGHQFEGPKIDWEMLNMRNTTESSIKSSEDIQF